MKPVNIRDLTNTILSKVPVVSLFIAGCILATPCEIVLASVFTVSNTDDSGTGSLRRAINNANASAGKDTVEFNILEVVVPHIIRPNSPLPVLMEPVVIDGTMPQPDFAGAPVIVLDGVFAGSTAGLILLGGDSTIRGLAIIRFSGNGIELKSQGNTVEGNYIGIGSDGTTAFGMAAMGLQYSNQTTQ